MDGATVGLIAGLVGATVGVAGGVIGTRTSLRRARTPDEHRFLVQVSVVIWGAAVVLGAVLVLMLAGVLPYWAYLVAMCVFFVMLGPGIAWANRRQRRLEKETREPGGDGGDPTS